MPEVENVEKQKLLLYAKVIELPLTASLPAKQSALNVVYSSL